MQGNGSQRLRKRYSATFKAQLVRMLLKDEKSLAQLSAEYGIHPNVLRQWRATALDGLGTLFSSEHQESASVRQEYEARLSEAQSDLKQLSAQVEWLRKNLVSALGREERIALIEWDHRDLPLTKQAELLGISRSSLYYRAGSQGARGGKQDPDCESNYSSSDAST